MLNWRFAKDYSLHRLTAGNRHGLHSPFVYRLVDKVIYDFKPKNVYAQIENQRKQLLHDGRASRRLSKPKIDQLLYRLVADRQPETIVEIGESAGITSLYLRSAAPNAAIYSLDALSNLGELPQLDLIIINSDETRQSIPGYFNEFLLKVHDNSLVIIADIYRNQQMKEAWALIKGNPAVTVTVDLFWMGLVYFKKGRAAKEDFKIRI